MGLDLARMALEVRTLATFCRKEEHTTEQHLQSALATLRAHAGSYQHLQGRMAVRTFTWLAAEPKEALDRRYPAQSAPEDYIVVASDGGHLQAERHDPVPCYLLNVGCACLRYGQRPEARLASQPELRFREEELFLIDPQNVNARTPVEGVLLDTVRSLAELRALALLVEGLAQLVEATPRDVPVLALSDGILVPFGLGGRGFEKYVTEALIQQDLLVSLGRLRAAGRGRPLALAGYISRTDSTNVVNTLRAALCPYQPINCDHHCHQHRDCAALDGLLDRDLFRALLRPGERSALFGSRSSLVRDYYGEHQIYFYYLHVGSEIARVEVPAWVAQDPAALELSHALILDQCRRGQGYPAALTEADEQARVTEADREQFWRLVGAALEGEGIAPQTSVKAQSKLQRAL